MYKILGFTLIELLIVVAIIAILAAIAIPNFLAAQVRAKVSRASAEMRSLATAVESYYVDQNTYPIGEYRPPIVTIEDRWRQLTTPVAYITNIFSDPFGYPDVPSSIPGPPYHYKTYDFLVDDLDLAGQHAFFTFLQSEGYSVSIKWYMASQGPDRVIGAVYPGVGILYDPSNGTVSAGDIIRVGP